MKMSNVLKVGLSSIALLVSSAGFAGTVGTLNVSAQVNGVCDLITTNVGLFIGNYIPNAGSVSNSATITVNCSSGLPYTIALGLDVGEDDASPIGRVFDGDLLTFALFKSSSFISANVWGVNTKALSATGTGANQNHTVFGQIFDDAGNIANAVDGSKTDTVPIDVLF